jgi:peptide deformylase
VSAPLAAQGRIGGVTIHAIRIAGDPVLHTPTREITEFDSALRDLTEDMFETMYAAGGVGLAANQIGVDLRVFVFDCPDADNVWHAGVVVNPELATSEIPPAGDPEVDMEGCLSVPFESYPTRRAATAEVAGFDLAGDRIALAGTGTLARCFQHETGHLDGHLYLEQLVGEYAEAARELVRERGWTGPGHSWLPEVPADTPRPVGRDFPTKSGRVRGPLVG